MCLISVGGIKCSDGWVGCEGGGGRGLGLWSTSCKCCSGLESLTSTE